MIKAGMEKRDGPGRQVDKTTVTSSYSKNFGFQTLYNGHPLKGKGQLFQLSISTWILLESWKYESGVQKTLASDLDIYVLAEVYKEVIF